MATTLDQVQENAKLLRVPEVAARLQLSVTQVYRLVSSGSLPAVRLGTSKRSPVRIDPRELDAWLRS